MADINWDEAVASSGFVRLEEDVEKKLVLKNFKLEEVEKFGEICIEFQAEVIKEDGKEAKEKKFTTTSKRLKTKLRPIFEKKKSDDQVKISILKIGDKFDTQYSVKEIVEEKKE